MPRLDRRPAAHRPDPSPVPSARTRAACSRRGLAAVLVLAAFALAGLAGCDSDPAAPDDPDPDPEPLLLVGWELEAVPGDGDPEDGLAATLTLYEYTAEESLAHLELADGVPGVSELAPAHLRAGPAGDGGEIAHVLGTLDLSGEGPGESWAVVPEAFESLADGDLHAEVELAFEDGARVLARGEAGANAGVEPEPSELTPPAVPATLAWPLDAVSNDGDLLPDGAAGHLVLTELGGDRTLVELRLDDGSPGTGAGHPAHIHEGEAAAGGPILHHLAPLDGRDEAPGSSWIVLPMTLEEIDALDAHAQVHEALDAMDVVLVRGDIGVNGEGTTTP